MCKHTRSPISLCGDYFEVGARQLILEEALAAHAHEAWSGWMRYLFAKSELHSDGSVTIPPGLVARWQRQAQTAYAALPEEEKNRDRAEAKKIRRIYYEAQQ